ncbi:MAG: hypothetical protein KJ893_09065 [Candidatus Omnitrophica bacterium]|nr:hypothetical protein [Candidatus Omnitrophota bacterium]MBU4478275.1 hypothetical protein [Candidatus Omnitrophota bacterium]MCG2703343.1 hypothetical protein [Candidatus Omnitrophota bacterium]
MGEHFLHYPLNFLALPRLVFLGRVFIYLAFAGVSIAATVAAVFQKEVEKSSVRYWGNFNRAVRKIPALFMLGIIYAIGLFLIYIIPKLIVLHLVGSERFLTIGYYGAYFFSFIFFVVMESALVYAVAFLIVYKHGLFSSIKKSTLFFKNHFAFTLFLVFSFRVINFALVLAKFKIVSIINKFFPFFPEFTLVILGAEIFFLLISNYFIIASACHLLLTKEGNK